MIAFRMLGAIVRPNETANESFFSALNRCEPAGGFFPVLFLRAFVAFVILPGMFAGLIPAWIASSDQWRGNDFTLGAIPLAIGAVILLWCVRDFFVAGKGTLAPWDPPKRLVVAGLYRFVRNPMYVGIVMLLAGWALITGSALLAAYSGVLAVAFHSRVVLYEEPRLRKQFGEEWTAYAASVPRWLPRLGPWH